MRRRDVPLLYALRRSEISVLDRVGLGSERAFSCARLMLAEVRLCQGRAFELVAGTDAPDDRERRPEEEEERDDRDGEENLHR